MRRAPIRVVAPIADVSSAWTAAMGSQVIQLEDVSSVSVIWPTPPEVREWRVDHLQDTEGGGERCERSVDPATG